MGTAIVIIILLIWFFLAVRQMVRNKKEGKGIAGCDGNCAQCNACQNKNCTKK